MAKIAGEWDAARNIDLRGTYNDLARVASLFSF